MGGIEERLMFNDLAVLEPPANCYFQLDSGWFGSLALGVIAGAYVKKAPNHIANGEDFLRFHVMEGVVLGDVREDFLYTGAVPVFAVKAEQSLPFGGRFPDNILLKRIQQRVQIRLFKSGHYGPHQFSAHVPARLPTLRLVSLYPRLSQSSCSSPDAIAGDMRTAELIRAKLYHVAWSAAIWTWFS